MNRRDFVVSVAIIPLTITFRNRTSTSCHLRVRKNMVMVHCDGCSFEPKIERQGHKVIILDELPPIVHLDMKF